MDKSPLDPRPWLNIPTLQPPPTGPGVQAWPSWADSYGQEPVLLTIPLTEMKEEKGQRRNIS